MKWLEVSLTLSGELAEPAADILTKYAPGGVALAPIHPDAPSLVKVIFSQRESPREARLT